MRIHLFFVALAAAIAFPAAVSAMSPKEKAVARHIAANLESSQLQGFRIGVKYEDGTAWLSGTVANMDQLRKAVEITKATNGVSRIVNKLQITTPDSISSQTPPEVRLADTTSVPAARSMPRPAARSSQAVCPTGVQTAGHGRFARQRTGIPVPAGHMPTGSVRPVSHDHAVMPGYAWPSYAAAPNYAALTYPRQYSPAAWPYIGPFYPYPQVPLGWRKVTLEWDDGWWMLDFNE